MINNSNLVRLTVLSFLLTQLSCIDVVGNGSIVFNFSDYAETQDNLSDVASISMIDNDVFQITDSSGNQATFTPDSAKFSQSLNFNGYNYLKNAELDQGFLSSHHLNGSSGYNISVYVECTPNDGGNYADNQNSVLISWEFDGCSLQSSTKLYCHATGNNEAEFCSNLDDETDLDAYIDVHRGDFWVHFTKARRILI